MKRYGLLLLFVTALFLAGKSRAAVIQVEEELSVSIPVSDDLYAAGGTVFIDENVDGDLALIGGDITINGAINQDLFIAGGDVDVDGSVGDDIRAAGGTLYLSALVGDDAILFGGEVTVRDDTVIQGDLTIFGGDVIVDGRVEGNVYIRGGSVRVHGNVGGNVNVQADILHLNTIVNGNVLAAATDLSLGTDTVIEGNLQYWQPQGEYNFDDVVIGGNVFFDEDLAMSVPEEVESSSLAWFAGLFGYSLLASALIILLAVLITKSYFSDAAIRLRKAPWMSVWYGFVYIVVAPVLAVAFLVTVIGIPIGLLIVISYMFTFYFIKPLTSIVFAKALEQRFSKKWSTTKLFFASFGIFFLWKVLVLVPIVGMFISSIAVLAGFGTLAHTEWTKFKKVR